MAGVQDGLLSWITQIIVVVLDGIAGQNSMGFPRDKDSHCEYAVPAFQICALCQLPLHTAAVVCDAIKLLQILRCRSEWNWMRSRAQ